MSNDRYTGLINRYLDGKTSGHEERELYEWLSLEDRNMERFSELKRIHDGFGIVTAEKETVAEARRKVGGKLRRRRLVRHARVAVAAAVVLIAAAAGWWFAGPGSRAEGETAVAFHTERAQIREVVLPDGSRVSLNADSKISYIFEENPGRRLVFLTGEAFFDVVRDTLNPFIVRTDDIDARVLGTKFTVSAYPDDPQVQATVLEGRVALSIHGSDTPAVEVAADDRATLGRSSGIFTLDRVDAAAASQWVHGTLVFREQRLADIVRRLERYYDMEVTLEDPKLDDMVYTATFDSGTPVAEILDLFVFTSPIAYEMNENHIEIKLKNGER